MANEQNLKRPGDVGAHVLTAEDRRRGAENSVKVRKEKSDIKKAINRILDAQCTDFAQFKKIAEELGVPKGWTVRELFVQSCLLRSVANGEVADLERFAKIIGELTVDVKVTQNTPFEDL
jgi:hypothetical protein